MATSAVKLPAGFELDEENTTATLPPGFELDNEPTKWKETLSHVARPVLEIGGALVGGTLGAGATAATVAGVPVGIAAGGALGMAGGKAASELLDTKLGLRPELKPKEIIGKTGKLIQYGLEGEAMGMVGGALAKEAVPLALKGIGYLSPSAIKMPAIMERFINKEGVVNALEREKLSNVAVNYHKQLANRIKALDAKAAETLSETADIPKAVLVDVLSESKHKFVGASNKAISPEAEASVQAIDNAIAKIQEINPTKTVTKARMEIGPDKMLREVPASATESYSANISQKQLKDLVSQHKGGNWNDPTGDAKKEIRNVLDGVLKSSNKDYAEAMSEVSRNIKLEKLVEKKFALKYDPSTGYAATDATAGKWSPKLLEGKAPESSKILKSLDKSVGGNLSEKVRLSNIKEQFTGDKTTGSRMVMLGRSIGSVLGPNGSTVGAMAGAMMDKAGGKVTGAMIDSLRMATANIGAPLNEKTVNLLFKTIYTMSHKSDGNKK